MATGFYNTLYMWENKESKPGDQLKLKTRGASSAVHYGILAADGRIYLLAKCLGPGPYGEGDGAKVVLTSWQDVTRRASAKRYRSKDKTNAVKSAVSILARAQGELGVVWLSSEHFVDFCRYAVSRDPEVYKHNRQLLQDVKPGDLIEFKRRLVKGKIRYSHWAVYKGEGNVYHFTGAGRDRLKNLGTTDRKMFTKAMVAVDSFWDAAGESHASRNNNRDNTMKPSSTKEILDRAESMLGLIHYNILWRNCEHFATYCRYDVARSDQVRHVMLYPIHLLLNWIFWLFFFASRLLFADAD